jgi:ribonuclease Z
MLKTFALRGRDTPLTIYGPSGLRDLVSTLQRIFGRLTYGLELVELAPGDTMDRDGYTVQTFPVEHGVPALGYSLVEEARPGRFDLEAATALGVPDGPARGALQRGEAITLADGSLVQPEQVLGEARAGRRVALTGDTRPAESVVEAVSGFDVLVHDATFCADELERARETGHSTAGEAALVGREAGVRLLALTHISSRYGGRDVEDEACALFPSTVVPRDFDTIEVPFPERGEPRLVHRGARVPRSRAESPA